MNTTGLDKGTRGFSSSTFLETVKVCPSVLVLFINEFLKKTFNQSTCEQEFGLHAKSVVDWKVFCSEVCSRYIQCLVLLHKKI